MSEPAPLLVFSDDWGRHPSSCQHLIRHIERHRRVTWVNTIGTRPPRLDRTTARRGFEKLRAWLMPGGADPGGRGPPNLRVIDPAMWPSFRSRFARGLNRRLLRRAVRLATESGLAPVIVTTLPVVADLVGRVRAARWIYYCVDDYAAWPGLDGRTLEQMEDELVRKVDGVIAVSETLQTRIANLGKPSHLLTHGVDLEHWRAPAATALQGCPAGLTDPLVIYWGVIDRRMDSRLVQALSEAMPEGTILLVGPQDNPEPELLRLPRVRTLPPVAFDDLPALAARAAVLIAPYADLPVTQAMQPLKLKEYLASGKPVVVRRLPATEEWADCADTVATAEEFARLVVERMRHGVPVAQARARTRLAAEDWAAKAALFEGWLEG